jgi:hemerythrin-like metal-binding protein
MEPVSYEAVSHEVCSLEHQHADLLAAIRRELTATLRPRAASDSWRGVADLCARATAMFTREHACMAWLHFPRVLRHAREHRRFSRQLAWLRDQLRAGGDAAGLDRDLCRVLQAYVREHVGRADRELAEYASAIAFARGAPRRRKAPR